MANIPIRDIILTGVPSASAQIVFDDGQMKRGSVSDLADGVRPVASQSEAQDGVDNAKTMTPLRVKQSIASEVGVSLQSHDDDLDAVAALTGTGLMRRTGAATFSTGTAVANSELATMAAYTLKGNNTSAPAAPTDVDIAGLTTKASPASGDYVMISDQAASGAWKKVTVSSLSSAGSVSSIAGNTGAFTLSTGITNVVNDIRIDTAVVPRLGVANTFTGAITANSFIPSSSTIPTNGLYLPAANRPALASNSTLMFQISQNGGLGRAAAFCGAYVIPSGGANGISMRGPGTTGVATFLDFADSALVQGGAINVDQGAHTTTYATSSDERLKPNREMLSTAEAERVVNALKIWDFDKDGNTIRGVGVLAQEAYQVVPRMVVKGDDNPAAKPGDADYRPWSAEKAYPVPYMIVALQDAMKRIAALEAEIAALKR